MEKFAAQWVRVGRPLIVGLVFMVMHQVLFILLVQVGNLFAASQNDIFWSSAYLNAIPSLVGLTLLPSMFGRWDQFNWFPYAVWFVLGFVSAFVIKENRKLVFVFMGGVVLLMGCGYLAARAVSGIGP